MNSKEFKTYLTKFFEEKRVEFNGESIRMETAVERYAEEKGHINFTAEMFITNLASLPIEQRETIARNFRIIDFKNGDCWDFAKYLLDGFFKMYADFC